ncbi:type I restriction endonuclease subunit R [Bartonella sp. M0187]|uniref:type I restriction endonuclease subunit R n=1 Tax=Bartonella apihabitans TaxID=2750929 RepID=UPI0018DB2BE5|nr:type I restriction endonuclease subunit R [Bartonella apihabitans]MBI0026534.1 type I restriction endonuclease subunit R [Bartonella apihabitans]
MNECDIECAGLEYFAELGYEIADPKASSPDGILPLRKAYDEVILTKKLLDALARINPKIPEDARLDALRKILAVETPSLVEENRRIHKMIIEGVDVEYPDDDGVIIGNKVWLIDFKNPENNDFLVTNQFTVAENGFTRRPDIVVFVNGLPLGVIELKNAASEQATLSNAFNQLQTYKKQIPSLFRTNAVLVTSDGLSARIGSLTAEEERFMPWRTVTGADGDFTPAGPREYETLIKGVFEKNRFLRLIKDFIVFGNKGNGPFKIVAGYHQYHGALKALNRIIAAAACDGDRKGGVVWHTQGSGKSLLMAFLGGLIVKSPELENPTLVVLTDRNDLDDQLFHTFSMCRDLIRQTPEQAEDRDSLRRMLDRASGGVVFTTMQKFSTLPEENEYPVLTERRNVIVMADEAHRSQYGFAAKIDRKTGETRYGYAHYVRQALPNASFIGFTGTPIERADINTPAVFGSYVDIYDISRAVEDKATVPIYYESRLVRLELDPAVQEQIDNAVDAMIEGDEPSEQEKQKSKWTSVEKLVGAPKRLSKLAEDMIAHLEARLHAMAGRAMVVTMSRRICVDLYNQIIHLRPEWHSEDDNQGVVKIVMTGSASDPLDWQQHIGNKKRRDLLAKRARDPKDPLKLVIVCDMWLTGFDAPPMHTMYIDKPMRSHGLMQAIARVNRVFKDKPGGLVVDYIGIGNNLKKALAEYTQSDRDKTGISEEEAVSALQECLDVVRDMYHGIDISKGYTGTPSEKLEAIADAMDWILKLQNESAAKAKDEKEKKRAHRRYFDAVTALKKANALASASELALKTRDEIGFYEAVRAALAKPTVRGKMSDEARTAAVNQLLDKAVATAEVVDILKAAGLKTQEISILSDDFLIEIQNMERKNLALEALHKLLNGEITSRSKTNIIEARAFSDRLKEAVARYHSNAISTVEMLQSLIDLAKDMRAKVQAGMESGLSPAEVAFYDALAENNSAVEAMGDEKLRVIAIELVKAMRAKVTIDWNHRTQARAEMRVLVKRLLRKFGYPPDFSDDAVKNVLAQAETVLNCLC